MNDLFVSDPDPHGWLLLENAHVVTLDAERPVGRAVLVGRGRVRAVFDAPRPDLAAPAGVALRRHDLEGRTVLPAFTDTHIHFLDWGIALGRADLESSRSVEEAVRLLVEFQRYMPRPAPGRWVLGRGWSHNQWRVPQLPATHAPLDELYPENPVALTSLCGHLMWVNGAALRAVGIDETTPDPPGGEIDRDPETGRPTGILKENAMDAVFAVLPPLSDAERREALRRAIREAHAYGVVGIHAVEPVETLRLYQEAHREGWLDMRVAFYPPVAVLDDLVRAGIRSGLGDSRLHIAGVKMLVDGSLGGRTAWMLEPYLEDVPSHAGIPTLPPEAVRGMVRQANTHGLSCAIHAIGDRAVREVLHAVAAAREVLGEAHPFHAFLRNRIEHCQTVHPDDFAMLRSRSLAACVQPTHLFADWRAADRFLGPDRARRTYPLRSLADAGALLAFGSDAPVATVNVIPGLYAAVFRRDLDGQPEDGWYPEECVTPLEALHAYCTAGPRITLEEADRGRLRPGHRADLVVLDADPLTAPPEVLRDAAVFATLFDGRWVHGPFVA